VFKKQTNVNPRIPSGMIAHTEKGYFYVKGEKRFRFVSERARESWNLRTVKTSESVMNDCKIVGVIGFRDGSLIRDISSGKIYLIIDNKKSLITNPDIIKSLGFKKHEIVLVSKKEAGLQKEGEPLDG